MNRGAIPLAVLVVASLAAGIVAAVVRIGEEEGPRAQPPPVVPVSPSPEVPASPSPVEPTEPAETPESPEPESPEPTTSPEPPETPEPGETPLAKTGGPVLPLFAWGLVLIAASGIVWRFSRTQ